MEVLEHANNINHIIIKSKEILKKEGVFIGSTINKTLASYFLAILFAENIFKISTQRNTSMGQIIKTKLS